MAGPDRTRHDTGPPGDGTGNQPPHAAPAAQDSAPPADQALKSSARLFEIMGTSSADEILQFGLEEAVRLTGSEIGYFHFVNPDQETIRLRTWSRETMRYCTVGEKVDRYPIAEAGVWVDCIHQRKPVIHNDYLSLPHKKGLPEGHVPLIRDLAVPVIEEGKIVAVLGVGNKAVDYTPLDIDQLSLFARNSWAIVQRKQAEEALRESEMKYRRLLESIPQKVFYKDRDSVYVAVNPSFAGVLGLDTEEIPGRTDFDFFPAEQAEKYREDDRRITESGLTEELDEQYVLNGEERTVHTLKTPVRDLNDDVVGILGIFWDITKRKRAENRQQLVTRVLDLLNRGVGHREAIRSTLQLVKEFTGFEAVGIRLRIGEDYPYFETRGFPAEFVEAERFLCAHDLSGQILRDSMGHPCLECMCGSVILGRTDPTLSFFTDKGSFWTNSTTALLASTTEDERQSRTRNRCNAEGYESVALIPLSTGTETIGLLQFNDSRKDRFTLDLVQFFEEVGASIGIAFGRKRAEVELLRYSKALEAVNKELERKNEELDEFTYVASHDLQEPLRMMSSFSGLLRKDLGHHLPERAGKDLGFIEEASGRMQSLVTALLDLSRSGRSAIHLEPISLGDCVEEALNSLGERICETGAEIVRTALPEVTGDRTMITQLYQNLIGNALKFRGDRPPVVVLTLETRSGEPVFGVRDNGIGIAPEHAEQVFAPFKRLHGRSEYEGSGIGLSICRKVVERHGGRIWVESRSGEGSHFLFTLGPGSAAP